MTTNKLRIRRDFNLDNLVGFNGTSANFTAKTVTDSTLPQCIHL